MSDPTRAVWRDTVIAVSDRVQVVDGYTYFPADAVDATHLRPSAHTTVCSWKGTASYYDVVVGDQQNANAAWSYVAPKPEAAHIAGWIAFWRGVEIRR
ncbi:MAG: DUF427 domain-containing protein [Deltaproteobacteria bacterium]|nr:DUF427 domain-containing protein [Deltaproteobacteria bacterium]